MIPALYIFALMVAVGIVLYLFDRFGHKQADESDAASEAEAESCTADCCSANEVCPSEMMLKGAGKGIEYFDDEELDQFRGRTPDAYTPNEEEQFRDVLYTLRPTDLLPWEQSMKKRGIMLPRAIRDEFIMLYSEQNAKHSKP